MVASALLLLPTVVTLAKPRVKRALHDHVPSPRKCPIRDYCLVAAFHANLQKEKKVWIVQSKKEEKGTKSRKTRRVRSLELSFLSTIVMLSKEEARGNRGKL